MPCRVGLNHFSALFTLIPCNQNVAHRILFRVNRQRDLKKGHNNTKYICHIIQETNKIIQFANRINYSTDFDALCFTKNPEKAANK